MKQNKYIGYYRVSTQEQGQSGLGLEAQKESVRSFCQSSGELIGEFTDIESGKNDNRANLQAAIQACVKTGAILVVKNLSRISRGGFRIMLQLEEAGVKYIESSSPHDNQLIKEIKFALAKEERENISERTSSALRAIKSKIENGVTHVSKSGNVVLALGNPENLTDQARRKGREIHSQKAYNNSLQAGKYVAALVEAGKNGAEITKMLNEAGFTTPRGKEFTRTQTHRLISRYAK